MPIYEVTFNPAGVTVLADPASFPLSGEGKPGCLLDIAVSGGVEIPHACGGAGVCGTCHVIVTQGMENLSEADDDELDSVDLAPGNTPDSRLACQAVVTGDVTVTIPDWNRNIGGE